MIKFVFAFLISLMTLPVLADTYVLFTADAVEYAINNLVESEYRLDAVNEYIKQMDEETGGISVLGIFKVCSAAGKSILTNDGYNDCKHFIEKMAEISGFDDVDEANKNNCVNKFGGVWAIVEQEDSSEYQCVGKDGYKLVYKKVCKDGAGECIKDFAGLKTQGPIGREFILEYGKRKGLNFTCHMGYETRRGITSPLGQDYIRCSVGGKAYEFEFDSLNAEPDKSFDYEVDALCNFFGGKLEKNGSAQKRLYCAIPANVKNYDFEKFASKIGHNATCELGKCRLLQYDEAVRTKNIGNLKTISGVNSYKFYNAGIQTNADMAKVQLEEYLHNIFPNKGRITCNSSIKKYNVGLNVYDYVMSCFVDSQPVDFVFDDLTESSETRVNAGIEAMQCITNGGTYKGEYCRGATREECDALDAVLRAKGSEEGAFWDDDARACVMGNSKKTYIVDTVKGYIVGAVFIVGAAIFVIATDGLAAPVVAGTIEGLLIEGAFTGAQYLNHGRLDNKAANRFMEFKNDADKCNDEACALNVIKNHWQTLNGVLDDLNKDDMAMVDETMDKLIGMIDLTEMVPCDSKGSDKMGFCTKLMVAEDSSEKRLSDYTDPVSEIALIIGDVIYNPGYVTQKFVKIHNGLQASKAIKASQVVDTTKDLSKTGKVLNAGTDVASSKKVKNSYEKLNKIQTDMYNKAVEAYNENRETVEQLNRLPVRGTRFIANEDGSLGKTVNSFQNQAEQVIRNEVLVRAAISDASQEDLTKFSKEVQKINRKFLEDASKVTSEKQFASLLKKRHYNIEKAISKEVNIEVKAQELAVLRKQQYMDIVKADPELKWEALHWKDLTTEQQAHHFEKIFKEAHPDVEPVKIKVVKSGIGESFGDNTITLANIEHKIQIDTKGSKDFVNFTENYDHAQMQAAHEFEHNLLRQKPSKGIIPANMAADTVIQNPAYKSDVDPDIGAFKTYDITGKEYITTNRYDYEVLNPNEYVAHQVGYVVGEGFIEELEATEAATNATRAAVISSGAVAKTVVSEQD